MRVLVVGGEGTIGRRVVRALREAGDDVTTVDLAAESSSDAQGDARLAGGFAYVQADVTSADQVTAAVRETAPDAIVHLASLLGPETAAAPERAHRINLGGTMNVLDAARACGVRRVATASSIAVFGSADRYGTDAPVEEETDKLLAAGVPLYAATKLYVEHVAQAYNAAYGMEIVGLRPSVVHGAGRKTGGGGPVMEALEQGALGNAARIPMAGVRVPLVYAEDVAGQFAALVHADASCFSRHHFFNSGGESCTVGELVDLLNSIVPDARLEADDTGERDLAGLPGRASDRALVEEVGYTRTFAPLEVAVRAHVDAIRADAGLPAV